MTHQELTAKMEERQKQILRIRAELPELILTGESEPVLRTPTQEVSLAEGIEISNKLKETLKQYREITGMGRGLAATQIGLSKAVFVTYVENVFKVYINPKITHSSKECYLYKELCVSCWYSVADVKRPKSITIEYMNEKGETVVESVDSFMARLLQHECDHLRGIINIDIVEKEGLSNALYFDPFNEQLREVGQ
jgi:peptide deformylase